jgi:hypothetical protein
MVAMRVVVAVALAACTPTELVRGTLAIGNRTEPLESCSSDWFRVAVQGRDPGLVIVIADAGCDTLPIVGECPRRYVMHVVDLAAGIDRFTDSTLCARFELQQELSGLSSSRFDGRVLLDCDLGKVWVRGVFSYIACGNESSDRVSARRR